MKCEHDVHELWCSVRACEALRLWGRSNASKNIYVTINVRYAHTVLIILRTSRMFASKYNTVHNNLIGRSRLYCKYSIITMQQTHQNERRKSVSFARTIATATATATAKCPLMVFLEWTILTQAILGNSFEQQTTPPRGARVPFWSRGNVGRRRARRRCCGGRQKSQIQSLYTYKSERKKNQILDMLYMHM